MTIRLKAGRGTRGVALVEIDGKRVGSVRRFGSRWCAKFDAQADYPEKTYRTRALAAEALRDGVILCQRCEHGSRHGTPATHRVEWREIGDDAHWENRVTLRCHECARALYAWLSVAHPDNYNGAVPGAPKGSIEKDEVI